MPLADEPQRVRDDLEAVCSARPARGPAEPCTDRPCFISGRRPSVEDVDHRQDVRDFLVSRRARVSPEQAGLPSYGGTRRVPGLRREEVAMLAGLSVDYYARLERGNLTGASESAPRPRTSCRCSPPGPPPSTP